MSATSEKNQNDNDMAPHYREMMNEGKCWRTMNICPAGKEFLKALYSWSKINPLHPMLVWKICDPCYYDHKPPPNLDRSQKNANQTLPQKTNSN